MAAGNKLMKAQRLHAIDALSDDQARDLAYELAARHMSPMNLLGLHAATLPPAQAREAFATARRNARWRQVAAASISGDPATARQLIAEFWHLPVVTASLLTTSQAARA